MKLNDFLRKYSLGILILFHSVGLVGIGLLSLEIFAALSPLNLLLTAYLVWINHEPSDSGRGLIYVAVGSVILGYLAELLGTQTGFPFGDYSYGPSLGWQLAEVPVIIGINWFLMLMGTGFIMKRFTATAWLRVVGGALLMTLIDLAIEPVAPALDFWYWAQGQAPVMNYLGWFAVSLIMHLMLISWVGRDENKLAPAAVIIMLAFFISLNLLL